MQTMTLQGAAAARTAGSAAERASGALRDLKSRTNGWLAKESGAFSLLAGESVTRLDVVKAHVGLLGFIALIILAELIEKGGAL